jgi:superoxide dismutase, Fe-Mn family
MNKRTFLKTSLLSGTGLLISGHALLSGMESPIQDHTPVTGTMNADEFMQPALGFEYNALEPYIDAMTMEIHYSKHHAAYTKNLNAALAEQKISGLSIEKILAGISKYPMAVRNNGGGYYNHNLYWKFITPGGSKTPVGKLGDAINSTFGSFEKFKDEFSKKAMSVFGSGWVWLVVNQGMLKITQTANQECPLMDIATDKGTPILCIDIWEHAYYLKYQNRRKEYVDNFWNVINWDKVAEAFKA